MKILVLSDSHGAGQTLYDIAESESPGQIIFLGDCISDLSLVNRALPSLPIICCRGNNDIFSDAPDEVTAHIGGWAVFATHGHRYGVKTGLSRLKRIIVDRNVDIVLYGHTHVPRLERDGGMIYVNPGSAGFSGDYAVIDTTQNTVTIKNQNGRIKTETDLKK